MGLFGSSSTTTSTNSGSASSQQNGQFDQSTNPIEQPWVSQLRQGFGPYLQQIMQQAKAPVYGQAQIGSYLGNLNDLASAATKNLSSNLASRGVLNSGAFSQGATDIQNNRLGQASQFFGQLPFMERQAEQQNSLAALASGVNLTGQAPIGQASSGSNSQDMNSQSSSTNSQTVKSNPGLGGILGSIAGIGLSGLTGGMSGGILGMLGLGGGGSISNPSSGMLGSLYGSDMQGMFGQVPQIGNGQQSNFAPPDFGSNWGTSMSPNQFKSPYL